MRTIVLASFLTVFASGALAESHDALSSRRYTSPLVRADDTEKVVELTKGMKIDVEIELGREPYRLEIGESMTYQKGEPVGPRAKAGEGPYAKLSPVRSWDNVDNATYIELNSISDSFGSKLYSFTLKDKNDKSVGFLNFSVAEKLTDRDFAKIVGSAVKLLPKKSK